MNLIEQLGGHEATKEKYKTLSDSDMITIGPMEFSAKDYFEDELLEYRRQHNIFEVGDICKLKIKHDFGLYKFQRIDGDRIYLEDRLGFAEFGINKGVVEHATDEEVKAGKRLEVNQ